MTYKAIEIANYIIKKANKENIIISSQKLQRALYFCYGIFYAKTGKKLFEEDFEAWFNGPVVKLVFMEFSIQGFEDLKPLKTYIDYVSSDDGFSIIKRDFDNFEVSPEDKEILDKAIEKIIKLSDEELLEMTKNQTPWLETFISEKRKVIPHERIRDFFLEVENEWLCKNVASSDNLSDRYIIGRDEFLETMESCEKKKTP